MSDVSQGPGWWQASDLKWYPPELHADYVAPSPPVTLTLPPPPKLPPPPTVPPPTPVTPTQPPVTTKSPSGRRKVGFVLAGLALVIALLAVDFSVNGEGGHKFVGLLAMIAVAIWIIGVTIAVVRSGQSGSRKVIFVIAMALVVLLALPGAVYEVRNRFYPHFFQQWSPGSPNSSSFCTDFHNLWDSVNGVNSAIMAVQAYDVGGSPYGGGGSRPPGWSDSDLQTAAKNAETLAAEAPSDQLKTDFTNIAQTLSAAATGDYRYHGTGSENLDVNGSTLIARCRLQGAPGH